MSSRRSIRTLVVAAALLCVPALTTVAAHAGAPAQPPGPMLAAASHHPIVGAGTHLVDEDAKLAGFSDAGWYEDNIPFLDVPDQQVEQVYYYRWRTWKEHLRYTNPQDGWISTEFLDCCGYAAPYQAIDAAAGHQITEGRWVRDQQYGDDNVRFWLTGPGASAKPADDGVNADTTDWAHEYSFWLASAAYGRAAVTGDTSALVAMLPELERQWHGWDKQFNPSLGLYWSVPVWDAMEFSASSYQSGDPYHGGAGYRPTLNSYQYGDATAISSIAALAGKPQVAREYAARAAALKAAMQKHLWDPSRQFYYHVARDDNPSLAKLDTREEIGFLPWAFDAAQPGDAAAWSQLFDPQGFAAPYGPTTAERRSSLFMRDAGNCCRWDGPSWPFSTSQTLTGMANLLDDYPGQPYVSAAQYADALHTYAATQYRNGKPYVAEGHSPDQAPWIYDSYNHSEDYNHSTYVDLVINGLMGLRPQTGNALSIKPLVPAGWDHFALENVPYHGHNVTLAYDRDGSHYGFGTGFRVFIDGVPVVSHPAVGPVTVRLPGAPSDSRQPAAEVNDAVNALATGYPKPITSYTWGFDNAWNAVDGKVWFNEVPENTRWTNYASPNAQDYYGVDFGSRRQVSDIRWYGYDDGGGIRPAAGYRLQYWTGSAWAEVPDQTRSTSVPVGNGLNRITFLAITTSRVRLLFDNPPGAFVGVTEFQSWTPSSRDADVTVGPVNAAGVVSMSGPTALDVTVHDAGRSPLTRPDVTLAVPDGWTVTRAVPAPRGAVTAARPAVWHFVVTPAADAPHAQLADVVATATYRVGNDTLSTHVRQAVRTTYASGQAEPVGSWSFDEGAGAVVHDGAGTHDLSLSGAPAWMPGESGDALSFDGTGQYAQTSGPVLDTTGNFSVAAWVRLNSSDGFATAVSQDGTTTSGFFLQYSKADDRFAFATGEGRALSDAAPVPGRWYHLVGVHDADAGTYTLYVDGQAQSKVLRQAQGDPADGAFAVGRGFSGGHVSDFWPGTIDTVRVWNRVLSAADVATLA